MSLQIFKLSLLICFLAFVTGCTAQTRGSQQAGVVTPLHKPGSIQPSSGDAGTWDVVGDGQSDMADPLVQHMLARKQVDPEHLSKKNAYIKTVDENHARDTAHFRTLRLDAKMAENGIYDAAGDTPKPAHKPVSSLQVSQANLRAPYKPEPFKVRPVSQITDSNTGRADQAAVENVRLGEHPGKTRIVLDVSRAVSFETWLQDDDYVLVVNLPNTYQRNAQSKVVGGHPLVKAYGFKVDGQATQFIVTFKRQAEIGFKSLLKPNDTYANHRIVLDVKAK